MDVRRLQGRRISRKEHEDLYVHEARVWEGGRAEQIRAAAHMELGATGREALVQGMPTCEQEKENMSWMRRVEIS